MARDEGGKWLPGVSGNPAGKPVGANSRAKEWQDEFFEADKTKAKEDWQELSAYQRWQIRAKYWDFQFPKLRSEHVDLNFDSMSDQFVGRILAEVLSKTIKNEVKYKETPGRDNNPGTDPA